MHLVVCYLSTFSNYCKIALRIIINMCFFYIGANFKQPIGADS